MDHTPRALFALLRAGERDTALRSNTPWICVSCYNCVVRCPQDIHITDVMYALKSMAIEAKLYEEALKTHCGGGHMTQIGPDVAFELIRRLVDGANRYRAERRTPPPRTRSTAGSPPPSRHSSPRRARRSLTRSHSA